MPPLDNQPNQPHPPSPSIRAVLGSPPRKLGEPGFIFSDHVIGVLENHAESWNSGLPAVKEKAGDVWDKAGELDVKIDNKLDAVSGRIESYLGRKVDASTIAIGGLFRATRGILRSGADTVSSFSDSVDSWLVGRMRKGIEKEKRKSDLNTMLGAVALEHTIGHKKASGTETPKPRPAYEHTEEKPASLSGPAEPVRIYRSGTKPHGFSEPTSSEIDDRILSTRPRSKSEKIKSKVMDLRLKRAEKRRAKEEKAYILRNGLPSQGSKISTSRTRLAKMQGHKGADAIRYREGWGRTVARKTREHAAKAPHRIAAKRLGVDVDEFVRRNS